MRYFTLPGISKKLSTICLGTAFHGSRLTEDESFALLDAFAARGGTFLDTAHVYADWLPSGRGASERTVGRWLRSRGVRDTVVVGTKGAHPHLETMPVPRLRPEEIARDLAESRERLQLDTIDLYWLHRDDPAIPVGEILDALDAHRQAGHLRAFGASHWRVERLQDASEYAQKRGFAGFAASQIAWSLRAPKTNYDPASGAHSLSETALAYYCQSALKLIPYSVQAGGWFGKPCPADTDALNARRWERAQTLAARRGISPTQAAVAYILCHPCGGAAVAGPRTVPQAADTCDAADIDFSRDELRLLEGQD